MRTTSMMTRLGSNAVFRGPVRGWLTGDARREAIEMCGGKPFYWLVVTGTMEFYDVPFSWEFHHPNWRTPSFFRGIETTNHFTMLESVSVRQAEAVTWVLHGHPWLTWGQAHKNCSWSMTVDTPNQTVLNGSSYVQSMCVSNTLNISK